MDARSDVECREFSMTAAEIRSVLWKMFRQSSRIWTIAVIGVVCVFVGLGGLLSGSGRSISTFLLILGCLNVFVVTRGWFVGVRKALSLPGALENRSYRFSEEGMELSSSSMDSRMSWTNFEELREWDDGFFLKSTGVSRFIFLPVRAFSSGEDRDAFRTMAREHVRYLKFMYKVLS
jgi:hypothetical protein